MYINIYAGFGGRNPKNVLKGYCTVKYTTVYTRTLSAGFYLFHAM